MNSSKVNTTLALHKFTDALLKYLEATRDLRISATRARDHAGKMSLATAHMKNTLSATSVSATSEACDA